MVGPEPGAQVTAEVRLGLALCCKGMDSWVLSQKKEGGPLFTRSDWSYRAGSGRGSPFRKYFLGKVAERSCFKRDGGIGSYGEERRAVTKSVSKDQKKEVPWCLSTNSKEAVDAETWIFPTRQLEHQRPWSRKVTRLAMWLLWHENEAGTQNERHWSLLWREQRGGLSRWEVSNSHLLLDWKQWVGLNFWVLG
jgi:hypothetical protein